jgi:hypothetical protein
LLKPAKVDLCLSYTFEHPSLEVLGTRTGLPILGLKGHIIPHTASGNDIYSNELDKLVCCAVVFIVTFDSPLCYVLFYTATLTKRDWAKLASQ